jgi:hypothetical protein
METIFLSKIQDAKIRICPKSDVLIVVLVVFIFLARWFCVVKI